MCNLSHCLKSSESFKNTVLQLLELVVSSWQMLRENSPKYKLNTIREQFVESWSRGQMGYFSKEAPRVEVERDVYRVYWQWLKVASVQIYRSEARTQWKLPVIGFTSVHYKFLLSYKVCFAPKNLNEIHFDLP